MRGARRYIGVILSLVASACVTEFECSCPDVEPVEAGQYTFVRQSAGGGAPRAPTIYDRAVDFELEVSVDRSTVLLRYVVGDSIVQERWRVEGS